MTDERAQSTTHRPSPTDRTAELVARLDAVERTLTGTDAPVSDLEDVAAVESRVSTLESTVESLADRLDEVDAATQAMRGFLGGVRAIDEDVERRADAALAKAESLEAALLDESDWDVGPAGVESGADGPERRPPDDPATSGSPAPQSGMPHPRAASPRDGAASAPAEIASRSSDAADGFEGSDGGDRPGRSLTARLRDVL